MPIKGSYILLIRVKRPSTLTVGRLGTVVFRPGFYAYVGSALVNLDKRIQRHICPEKKIFWHIDYLTQAAEIAEVFRIEREERLECTVARLLSGHLEPVVGFGCSDCSCKSHLFYSRRKHIVRKEIGEVFASLSS